jgi:hypothetical protein
VRLRAAFRFADDRVHRRAQLVAHVGQELRLVLTGERQLPAFFLDFEEETGVVHRDRRLCREVFEEPDDRGREFARRSSPDDQRPDHLIGANQRDSEQCLEPGASQRRSGRLGHGVQLDVGDLRRTPARDGPRDDVVAGFDDGVAKCRECFFVESTVRARHEILARVLDRVDGARISFCEPDRRLNDGVQHCLQLKRGAQHLTDLAQRPRLFHGTRELLRARLELLKHMCVVDRDDRLIGECRQQALHIGEIARFGPLYCEDSEQRLGAEQRHGKQRAPTHFSRCLAEPVFSVQQYVGDFDDASAHDASAGRGAPIELQRNANPVRPAPFVETIKRRGTKLSIFERVDHAPVGPAKPDRALDQSFEDHIERARGAPDNQFEGFAKCRLAGEGISKRPGPLLDLLLQTHCVFAFMRHGRQASSRSRCAMTAERSPAAQLRLESNAA